MNRVLSDRRLVSWVAVCLPVLLAGCSAARPGVVRSRLSGTWQPVEGPADQLVIQPDGTFDLTHTMLPMAGDPRLLRKAGDAIDCPDAGYRLEIIASEFMPELSYIRLKETRRSEGDQTQSAYAQYRAELEEDGRILVRSGVLPDASTPPDSLPGRIYQRTGDAPQPPEPSLPPADEQAAGLQDAAPADAKWVAKGRRQFAGTNWFTKVHVYELPDERLVSFLITPREDAKAKGCLVVRIRPAAGSWTEDVVGSTAVDCVRRGCSLLLVTVPELEPYGRPDDGTVREFAQRVVAQTQAVAEQIHAAGCALMTDFNGTYIAHYIWQTDNSLFDACFCADSDRFRWYGAPSRSDPDKALFLFMAQSPGAGELHRVLSMVDTYAEHGFPKVYGHTTEEPYDMLVERIQYAAMLRRPMQPFPVE